VKRHRNNKILKKIALILKNLRDEKGLTQEYFYNDTGINTASHFIIAQNELSRAVLTTSKLKI
jgi:hypothetical protein